MSKKKQNRNRFHHIKLSPTEMSIMREEHDDPSGAQRNMPLLQQLLLEDQEMSRLLFSPTTLAPMVSQVTQYVNSQKSLISESIKDEDYYQVLLNSLLPYFKVNVLLNHFTRIAKDRKIKREKRTLLWAVGDLMAIAGGHVKPLQSNVFETIVKTSIEKMNYFFRMTSIIFEGKEPFHFNYEDYLGESFPADKFQLLYNAIASNKQEFHYFSSLSTLVVFDKITKPFGLPFYEILRYPAAMPKKKSSLIVSSSDEADEQNQDKSDEEQYHNLIHALRRDHLTVSGKDWAAFAIQSLKNAAFGEMEPERLNEYLNGIMFSFLFPYLDNPLLITLYQDSGEHAGELIPDDERNDWIEITSAPENPQGYRNYGDTLLKKENWQGARKAYMRAGELMDEIDAELKEKIESLKLRLLEQIKELHHHDHDCDHDCDDPHHHHHD